MTRRGYANRGHRDAIHDDVGEIFTRSGWSGLDLSALGNGAPDWLFARGPRAVLVEVKSPRSISHQRKGDQRNPKQVLFALRWNGLYKTVESLAEAVILRQYMDALWKRTT